MVAGLEEITAGEIRIGDQVVNDLPPMDRNIAMVFQNYALYPHKTVFDNMAFGLQMRGYAKPDIDKRVREAAEMLGIQPLLERKPRQLSGGQRQRVAVGRAIVRHPQVFLFDEPLSNLDAKLRVQMRVELKRLHELLHRKPKQLSGGQQQRVALGRCIVRNPQVFLFDEPLSNLDAKLRAQMRIEIKRLHAQMPTTSVFVTHDPVSYTHLTLPTNSRV